VFLRRVAVYVEVFPAVAKIGIEAVKAYEAAFVNEPVAFGWPSVMLMYFREAVREIEFLVIDGVIKGQFYEVELRKYFFEGGAHIGVEAVVVVNMQEAAAFEVFAEVLRFGIAERPPAVAGHVYEGIIKDISAAYFHMGFREIEVGM